MIWGSLDLESKIENLEPKKVFKYFADICKIPHGSGNLDGIVDYLVNFAKERNLEYVTDDAKNVIIYSSGRHSEPTENRRGEACEPNISSGVTVSTIAEFAYFPLLSL